MTKIYRSWYTREDQVSSITFRMTKEMIENDQEIDQNMSKMMTQLDILAKNFIGSGSKSVNVVGIIGLNPYYDHFEVLYNEESNILSNQGGSFCQN